MFIALECIGIMNTATAGVDSGSPSLQGPRNLHFKKVSNENTISVFCRRKFIVHKIKKIMVKISPPNSNYIETLNCAKFVPPSLEISSFYHFITNCAQFKVSM